MRRVLLGLLLATLIHNALATTIVVGTCAKGDYEFNDLYQAIMEAEDHWDSNVVICGVQKLETGITIRAHDVTIGGGMIQSNDDRITIYGDDVTLQDLNLERTRIRIVADGDVLLRGVNSYLSPDWRYCIDVNAEGAVTIDGLRAGGCEYGVQIRKAGELNVWRIYVEGNTTALLLDPANIERIVLNPVERIVERTVEKVVERNVPVKEIAYRVPPELSEELESCQQLVGVLQKKKDDLQRKVFKLQEELDEMGSQRTYPDVWAGIGLISLGLAVGYLLGRM